jgi:hypothetical protein
MRYNFVAHHFVHWGLFIFPYKLFLFFLRRIQRRRKWIVEIIKGGFSRSRSRRSDNNGQMINNNERCEVYCWVNFELWWYVHLPSCSQHELKKKKKSKKLQGSNQQQLIKLSTNNSTFNIVKEPKESQVVLNCLFLDGKELKKISLMPKAKTFNNGQSQFGTLTT